MKRWVALRWRQKKKIAPSSASLPYHFPATPTERIGQDRVRVSTEPDRRWNRANVGFDMEFNS